MSEVTRNQILQSENNEGRGDVISEACGNLIFHLQEVPQRKLTWFREIDTAVLSGFTEVFLVFIDPL